MLARAVADAVSMADGCARLCGVVWCLVCECGVSVVSSVNDEPLALNNIRLYELNEVRALSVAVRDRVGAP